MLHDLRFGLRQLAKTPTITAVVVLALALGIGANTAIFSITKTLLFQPLLFDEAERLVAITETQEVAGEAQTRRFTGADFADFRRESRSFETLAAIRSTGKPVTSLPNPLNPLLREASANYFEMTRVSAILGRTFLPEEDRAGGPRVAVLTYGFWQQYLGGSEDVLGTTIGLGYEPYEIVGVLPPDFRDPLFPTQPVLYLPLALPEHPADRGERGRAMAPIAAFARLKDGVTLEEARDDLEALAAALAERYPETNEGRGVAIDFLINRTVQGYRPTLVLLFLAVGLVLAIACGNVANLLLARTSARRKEIALRLALGARRRHLIRQLLVESLLLSLLGGGLGVLLAWAAIGPLKAMVPAGFGVPRLDEVAVDTGVLAFTAVLSLATGFLFGLAPARQALRSRFEDVLTAGAVRSTLGRAGQRTRNFLVITEVAFSLVLLAGAGLTLRSFVKLQGQETGLVSDGVLTLRTTARGGSYEPRDQWPRYFRDVRRAIEDLPAVESVGGGDRISAFVPWTASEILIPGREDLKGAAPQAAVRTVTPGYFEALSIPRIAGRDFTDHDGPDDDPVAIVNAAAVRLYWGGTDPLDRTLAPAGGDGVELRIVGVVGDVIHGDVERDPRPMVYLPYAQNPVRSLTLAIRTRTTEPASVLEEVSRAIWSLSVDAPVYRVFTFDDRLAAVSWQQRFVMKLLGGFALLALLLAAVGLYAVLSYFVTERQREIGIRVAIGARRAQVLGWVLGRAAALAGVGLGIGVALSAVVTDLLASQLYGVTAADPVTYVGISLLLGAVTVVASAVPALRATRLDPVEVLRSE